MTDANRPLLDMLDETQRHMFLDLKTPFDIQTYLDSIPYVSEDLNRSPLRVMRDRQCHCLDGGLFAAAALRQLGYRPLILDLIPEPGTDDDHVLAIFSRDGLYGALAKSNFVGLRYREPIYRGLRELVMSYFEFFFNIDGVKTMRGYTRPLDLNRYDRYNWLCSERGVEKVVQRFYRLCSIPVLSAQSAAKLSLVDKRTYDGGLLGVNYDGLYRPGESH